VVARRHGGVAGHGEGAHGARGGKRAVRSELCRLSCANIRLNRDDEVELVPPTAEEAAVQEAQEADRDRQWATAVRMCMDAARPSERAEWMKDQLEQQRQEEYQERANLHLPSNSSFGGDEALWQDYSTAGYVA
jgi:polyphosphate kinase